jgi:calcineurin-like phosphoesterase family protein
MSPYFYTSDSHFHHANIMQYRARPFATVEAMNATLWRHLETVDAVGGTLVHAGNVAFRRGMELLLETHSIRLPGASRHLLVVGNHDRWILDPHLHHQVTRRLFGRCVGVVGGWRTNAVVIDDVVHGRPIKVLVSHRPQRDLQGAAVNVYGHVHNSLARASQDGTTAQQEEAWVIGSAQHFNATVELSDYRPQTLEALMARRAHGTFLW